MSAKHSYEKIKKIVLLTLGLTAGVTLFKGNSSNVYGQIENMQEAFKEVSNDTKTIDCLSQDDALILSENIRALIRTDNEKKFAEKTTETLEHIENALDHQMKNHEFEKVIIFTKHFRTIAEKNSLENIANLLDKYLAQAQEKLAMQQDELKQLHKIELTAVISIMKYYNDTKSWLRVPPKIVTQIDHALLDNLVVQIKKYHNQKNYRELLVQLKQLRIILQTAGLQSNNPHAFGLTLHEINKEISALKVILGYAP